MRQQAEKLLMSKIPMMIRSTPEVNIPILKTFVLSLLADSFDIKGAISAPETAITTSASDDFVALRPSI